MKYTRLRIDITNKCNLHCAYCHAQTYEGKILDFKEISKIIKEANRLGCRQFSLLGGEPFMNPFLFDIVSLCRGEVFISTNGHFFTEENIQKIQQHKNITRFRVSLDGTKNHNLLRRGSDYKKVLEGIKLVKKEIPRMIIEVRTAINRLSYLELMELYEFLKEAKVDRWKLIPLWVKGRTKKESSFLLGLEDLEMVFEVYKKLLVKYFKENKPMALQIYNVYNSDLENADYENFDINVHPCSYALDRIVIDCAGGIMFCPLMDLKFGDYRDFPNLKEALNNKSLAAYRKLRIKDLSCKNCRYLYLCGGGCRANSLAYLGDLKQVDPIACIHYSLLEKEILPILPRKLSAKIKKLINTKGDFPNPNWERSERR